MHAGRKMKMDIWTELRNKAQERRDAVYTDPKSTEKDKKLADDVVRFFRNDDYIRNAPKDTLFELFKYLKYKFSYPGYEEYEEMYAALLKEIDRKYILIDPDWLPPEIRDKFKK